MEPVSLPVPVILTRHGSPACSMRAHPRSCPAMMTLGAGRLRPRAIAYREARTGREGTGRLPTPRAGPESSVRMKGLPETQQAARAIRLFGPRMAPNGRSWANQADWMTSTSRIPWRCSLRVHACDHRLLATVQMLFPQRARAALHRVRRLDRCRGSPVMPTVRMGRGVGRPWYACSRGRVGAG